MEKYQCEVCGKKHDVYYGVGSPEPDCMHSFSEEEKEKRVEQYREKMLLLDKSFFLIKGTIFIEIKDISGWFRFEVWASIEVNYYLERLKEDEIEVSERPFFGKLENDFFFYDDAKGIKVDVIFPIEGDEVIFKVLEENHPMTVDQKNGISKEKVISWMQKIHHPKPIKKDLKKESFQVRFEKIIKEAKTGYLAKQKSFIIDVGEGMILFQIVSSDILGLEKTEDGFVIYLPFDISDSETEIELEIFKKTKYFNEFEHEVFDEIPTYYLMIENEKRLIDLSSKIIKEVYQVEIEDVDFDIYEP